MIVFKTFLKVLKACSFSIILYTVLLIVFGGINMQTGDGNTTFVASKPDILIVNHDDAVGITKNLIDYIEENSNVMNIKNQEDAVRDALFYRDIHYVIYIPEDFREDFLAGKKPTIQVESTGDYQASLAEMMLERYLKVANIYQSSGQSEEEIVQNIDDTLSKKVTVEMTSKLDTDNLSRAIFYYNFASYSILAGCIYVVCLILTSFRQEKIRKRTVVSSMSYQKLNRQLLLSSGLFALVLWIFYTLLGIFLLGEIMFTTHGLVLIFNSFLFTICALALSFLIANVVQNKNTINGIVNVVALGSSFLCGAFVPVELLPNFVLTIAHVLPAYWYIQTNEALRGIEVWNFDSLYPILINMGVILIFIIVFVLLTNIASKRKQKIG